MKSLLLFLLSAICTWGSAFTDGEGIQFVKPLTQLLDRVATEYYSQIDSWNLLDYGGMLENTLVDLETGQFLDTENYQSRIYIPVDSKELSALCATGTNRFYLAYYDGDRQCMGCEILLVTGGQLLHLPQGCNYVSISAEDELLSETIFVQEGGENVFLVSKEDTMYSSIKKAVAQVEEKGVILVFPGTYKENIKAWGKNITIIGTDAQECILVSYSASYYAPPLEIGAGEVRNLTIQAKGAGSDSKPGAYGVHVEDNYLYDNTLIFADCIIESDSNSAVGMGMRGGCEVVFSHCVLTGKEDGLFCHDGAYKKYTGVQNLTMEDCIIEGKKGGYAIRFDSQGVTGARINVKFVNNTLINNNNRNGKYIQTRNNGGRGGEENWMGLKNYYLDPESHGNNAEEMNYNQ